MLKASFNPEEIGPSEDGRRLRILWEDGQLSELEPRLLRLLCPCAGCVDERSGSRMLTPGMIPEDVSPLAIHPVGRYALQFVWSDGHRTGIYPFEYLRRIADGEAD
jgi:DUF971 family protein